MSLFLNIIIAANTILVVEVFGLLIAVLLGGARVRDLAIVASWGLDGKGGGDVHEFMEAFLGGVDSHLRGCGGMETFVGF